MKYESGRSYERWTPFLTEEVTQDWGDGSKVKSWRPGHRFEPTAPDDFDPVWDGEGAEIRHVVAVCQIDGGGIRILYRRQWRRPDGVTFGKKTVRMTTPSAFGAWLRGSNASWWRDCMRRKEFAERQELSAA